MDVLGVQVLMSEKHKISAPSCICCYSGGVHHKPGVFTDNIIGPLVVVFIFFNVFQQYAAHCVSGQLCWCLALSWLHLYSE